MDNTSKTWEVSEIIHSQKHRQKGEDFKTAMARIANALKDNDEHFLKLKDIYLNRRYLPAGRVQRGAGSTDVVTLFNCFVMNTIPDSMEGIADILKEAMTTLRMGGGVGYDFSTLRPKGDNIKTLDSPSSGPVSFMRIFDTMCSTISSAGHRRGAQMATMRVDHPDIMEFITCKNNHTDFLNFNTSVLVTDKFMHAVLNDEDFDLVFNGVVYKTVRASNLWDAILRSTWDWAEPGVLFVDTINKKNNLWYIEDISCTNPCSEQPLPPYGACLLGSINLVAYLKKNLITGTYTFDYEMLKHDIPHLVRANDNVIDRSRYPLEQQKLEAQNKRRMGIGVTGVANTIEAMGHPYGSSSFLGVLTKIMEVIRDTAYRASVSLAVEKGPFPLFNSKMLDSDFCQTLPWDIKDSIRKYGIRNSHLLSVAPTGTISITAGNISSGLEPVFSYKQKRRVRWFDADKEYEIQDYGYEQLGVEGKVSSQCTIEDHINVLLVASKFVDSACSKTCNVGPNVTWDQFNSVYMKAYRGGASGCTTFRPNGKRGGILVEQETETVKEKEKETACYIDPETGQRSCE